MFVIGLAGGSGSGKSVVTAFFGSRNIPTFDCDAVYHELISRKCALTISLARLFGDGILQPDGSINRRALADIVFADEEKRLALNRITHEHVLTAMRDWLQSEEKKGYSVAVVDAPLLFESGFDRDCDVSVAVTAPAEVRIRRIIDRDGITRKQAIERISVQIPDEELTKRADFVIRNESDVANVERQFNYIMDKIEERRKKK